MSWCPSLEGPGTPERVWQAAGLDALPRWSPRPATSGRSVVVAPHPDDEILGVGGTLARLGLVGSELVLVAVTDGEASHPGRQAELRRRRPAESAAAATTLGIAFSAVHRLGHPDGAIDQRRLTAELEDHIRPGDLVFAPWWMDGHPDHESVGRAATRTGSTRSAEVVSYLVWTWHWATPADLPWPAARRVDLDPEMCRSKREAVGQFATQLAGPDPILPGPVVERLTRDFEVVLRR